MADRDDGGPAFAALATTAMGDVHHQLGMTLRDWFAGQALIGLVSLGEDVAKLSDVHNKNLSKICAKSAYLIADAMLAERAK